MWFLITTFLNPPFTSDFQSNLCTIYFSFEIHFNNPLLHVFFRISSNNYLLVIWIVKNIDSTMGENKRKYFTCNFNLKFSIKSAIRSTKCSLTYTSQLGLDKTTMNNKYKLLYWTTDSSINVFWMFDFMTQ